MNALSFWHVLAVVGAAVLTALMSVGAVAWRAAHRRARASASGVAAGAGLSARTTSAFIDLDPRGIAPRAAAPSAPSAQPAEPVMVPRFVPVAPSTITATTLAGRARARIRVVATTESPVRAGFSRHSPPLRLVPAATVQPLDSSAASGQAQAPQGAKDARSA